VTSKRNNVIYYPPTAADIQAYTRTTCQELGGTISVEFDTPEVKQELAGLMKVVASFCSKRLNREVEILDIEPTQE
jgi:hypothetical protein